MAEKLSWGEGRKVHLFEQAVNARLWGFGENKEQFSLIPNLTASHDTMTPFRLFVTHEKENTPEGWTGLVWNLSFPLSDGVTPGKPARLSQPQFPLL